MTSKPWQALQAASSQAVSGFPVTGSASSGARVRGPRAEPGAQEEPPDDDSREEDEDESLPDEFDEEGEEDDRAKVVRRAVRRYPEESQELFSANRQALLPMERELCACPEMLSKRILGAIVVALAFLAFFSTSALLLVSVWVLRMAEKQKKTTSSPSPRTIPPIPPPRPEHTYAGVQRRAHGYEPMRPTLSPNGEGIYLSASELHPGPKIHRELYVRSSHQPLPIRSPPEDPYVIPLATPPLPLSPTVKELNHQSSQSEPNKTPPSPASGTKGSKRGADDPIYEELN